MPVGKVPAVKVAPVALPPIEYIMLLMAWLIQTDGDALPDVRPIIPSEDTVIDPLMLWFLHAEPVVVMV